MKEEKNKFNLSDEEINHLKNLFGLKDPIKEIENRNFFQVPLPDGKYRFFLEGKEVTEDEFDSYVFASIDVEKCTIISLYKKEMEEGTD